MIAVWRRATEFDRAILINAGLLFPHAFGKREEWFAALAMCPLFDGAVGSAASGWVLTIPEGPFRAISVGEGGIYEVCVEELGETPEGLRVGVVGRGLGVRQSCAGAGVGRRRSAQTVDRRGHSLEPTRKARDRDLDNPHGRANRRPANENQGLVSR